MKKTDGKREAVVVAVRLRTAGSGQAERGQGKGEEDSEKVGWLPLVACSL